MTRRTDWLTSLSAYLAIAAVAAVGLGEFSPGLERWVAGALLACVALLFALSPGEPRPEAWKTHGYLAAQTLVVGVILYLAPGGWNIFPTLFFMLSAQAVTLVPQRQAYAWMVGFTLVTAATSVLSGGLPGGLLSAIPFAAGYFFFGSFAHAWVEADAARREKERLLGELGQAYRQLEEYAARVEALTIVEERTRIAREFHDTLGHALTALDVQLELLRCLPAEQEVLRRETVASAQQLVKQGLSDVRRAVHALRPAALETLSLADALADLARQHREATGMEPACQVEGVIYPLSPRLAVPLYRAAQEALTNVRRHAAGAGWVSLALCYGCDTVSLRVENDLPTPPVATMPGGGHGLQGLSLRANSLGGSLTAGETATGTFLLEMRLPVG